MCEATLTTPKGGSSLDTSEQLDQNALTVSKTPILERSNPTDPSLKKRARSKYFSVAIVSALYPEGSKLKWAYFQTFKCSELIVQDADGKKRTHFCGNRWCLVCNRIRTARAILRYMPALEAWRGDSYMVTLTVRNCRGYQTRSMLEEMYRSFTSCKRSIKRTHGLDFVAIRKLEVTYNAEADTYHPHFHVIIRGEIQARALRALWLKFAPTDPLEIAQDVRPVDERGEMELFKYFTKMIGNGKIHARSLNVMFEQIKGLRTYQPIGFKISDYAPELEDDAEEELDVHCIDLAEKRYGEVVNWIWIQDYADWVDPDTGECLTDYTPSDGVREFVAETTPEGFKRPTAEEARTPELIE